MAGIILLLFLFIALVVYCLLIYLPIRWAKRRGIAGRKRLYIGIASFIIVSALFFGKNLVSYTAFKYYCANEAGLTVYKTLAQWKAENPGVWETLRKVNDFRDYKDREKYADVALEREFDGNEYRVSYGGGNQRIISYYRDNNLFWGAVNENVYILFDNKTQEILSVYKYYMWTNTWDSTTDLDGYRSGSIFGKTVCDPDGEKSSIYNNSFSNFNLIQKDEEHE